MRAIGIDVGSTYTKYCLLDEEMELLTERTPTRQREFFEDRLRALRDKYGDCPVVSCGYGRRNVMGTRNISELSALAAGIAYELPEAATVMDIGGQDTKLIRQEGGKLRAFFVNDKCAAGCGMFLGNVLNLLSVPFENVDLSDGILPGFRLSSTCAVFAQSEIVELIAGGETEDNIIRAVLVHILTQAKTLLGKVDCETVALSGGLTQVPGIVGVAEKIWEKQVTLPQNASYLSAIGCALTAERR